MEGVQLVVKEYRLKRPKTYQLGSDLVKVTRSHRGGEVVFH